MELPTPEGWQSKPEEALHREQNPTLWKARWIENVLQVGNTTKRTTALYSDEIVLQLLEL
jgi:hypothetical protein